MRRLTLFVMLFFLIGGLLIYQDTREEGTSFTASFTDWLWQLGGNVKSVTGFAVKEHDWLPNATQEDD